MSYYTNLTLKGPSQQEIVRAIQENPREALVSPTYSDATVVYDLESEVQDGRGYKFVEPLSRRLNCLGFYVSCADGKICYRLYKNGQIIDDYDSCPGYFDSDEGGNRPEGGDAAVLCREFGIADVPGALERVEDILRNTTADEPNGEWYRYVDPPNRHRDLCEALRLPDIAVWHGYDRIAEGFLPDGLSAKELVVLHSDGGVEGP